MILNLLRKARSESSAVLTAHGPEIFLVGIAHAIAFAGNILSLKLAASILGPSDYGRLATVLAIGGVIHLCLFGGIAQVALRFYSNAMAHNTEPDFRRALMKLYAIASALVFALLVGSEAAGLSQHIPANVWLLFVYTLGGAVQMVLLGVLNAARARLTVCIIQSFDALFRPAAIFLAARSLDHSPSALLFAYTITALVVPAVSLIGLSQLQTYKGTRDSSLFRRMLGYAAPFSIFGALGAMSGYGERLLLTAWVPWQEIGIYALMSQIALAPTTLFVSVANQFYLPLLFQQATAGRPDFKPFLAASGIGLFLIVAAATFGGPYLVLWLSSSSFAGYEHLLGFMAVSAGLFSVAQQLVLPGMLATKPSIYLAAKIVHAVSLFAGAFLLVPDYGIKGMVIASLMSSVLYLTAVIMTNRRVFGP